VGASRGEPSHGRRCPDLHVGSPQCRDARWDAQSGAGVFRPKLESTSDEELFRLLQTTSCDEPKAQQVAPCAATATTAATATKAVARLRRASWRLQGFEWALFIATDRMPYRNSLFATGGKMRCPRGTLRRCGHRRRAGGAGARPSGVLGRGMGPEHHGRRFASGMDVLLRFWVQCDGWCHEEERV
jgi:hypothetical protein